MRYSHLVPVLVCLLATFGEVPKDEATQFQEEFCGEGALTAGVRLFGLKAGRRDVSCLQASREFVFVWACAWGCAAPKPVRLDQVKRNAFFDVLTATGFFTALQGVPWQNS